MDQKTETNKVYKEIILVKNTDTSILISVIVPVYKVEPYLRACVDSILAQTYTNLEIILVDDGSPDSCGAICDEYAEKDSRVRVIHKANGGLSDARNVGMAVCTGEFLTFVDSDDLLTPNTLELLYSLAEVHHAELVIGGHARFTDESGFVFEQTEVTAEVMTKQQAMTDFFKSGCASWARLYRRNVQIDVSFPVGEINEDEAIVLHLLDRCETVVKTERIVYGYRTRPESITTSTFSLKKLDWYRHCKANLEWIRENYPELEEAAAHRYRSSILYSLTEIALADRPYQAERDALLADLKVSRKLFSKLSNTNRADKLRVMLLTYFPFLLYRFIVRRRQKR